MLHWVPLTRRRWEGPGRPFTGHPKNPKRVHQSIPRVGTPSLRRSNYYHGGTYGELNAVGWWRRKQDRFKHFPEPYVHSIRDHSRCPKIRSQGTRMSILDPKSLYLLGNIISSFSRTQRNHCPFRRCLILLTGRVPRNVSYLGGVQWEGDGETSGLGPATKRAADPVSYVAVFTRPRRTSIV